LQSSKLAENHVVVTRKISIVISKQMKANQPSSRHQCWMDFSLSYFKPLVWLNEFSASEMVQPLLG